MCCEKQEEQNALSSPQFPPTLFILCFSLVKHKLNALTYMKENMVIKLNIMTFVECFNLLGVGRRFSRLHGYKHQIFKDLEREKSHGNMVHICFHM